MPDSACAQKKIMLIAEPASGGVRRHLVDLLSELDTERFSVTLLHGTSRMDRVFTDALPSLGVRVRIVGIDSLRRELSLRWDGAAFFHIYRLMREIKPDVVHCLSSKAGVLGRWAARLLRVPVILYSPHGYSFQAADSGAMRRRFYIVTERVLSQFFTTQTLNVSRGERATALMERLDTPEKFAVIYNGLPPLEKTARLEARRALHANEGEMIVGTAARVDVQKAPTVFLEIARRVLSENGNIRFVYLGDGPLLETMREKVRGMGLERAVCFPGYCANADFLVEGFDLFLSTSCGEGLPYGLLEAVRAGVPLVATDVTGNNEVVRERVNGLLFPVGDAAAGALQVCRLLSDSSLDTQEIQNDFLTRFSLKCMTEQIEAQYDAGREP